MVPEVSEVCLVVCEECLCQMCVLLCVLLCEMWVLLHGVCVVCVQVFWW